MKINVLVGIPGSGKDYYLENKLEDNSYILSSQSSFHPGILQLPK